MDSKSLKYVLGLVLFGYIISSTDSASPCNGECYGGTCSDVEICVCNPGWDGDLCDQCADGYTGPGCAQQSGVVDAHKFLRKCEAKSARLECDSNQTISIDNVFFGRKSESICRHRSGTNTDCESPDSALKTLRSLCEGRQECWVHPFNYVLGEGCYGTYKYLEVEYTCRDCDNMHNDKDSCDNLAKRGFCEDEQFSTWMSQHCYKACSQCHISECGSEHDVVACDYWAGKDECNENPNWMLPNCKTSCRDCIDDGSSDDDDQIDDSDECVDEHDTAECEAWMQQGMCVYLTPWMEKYCGMTCGFCTEIKKVLACEGVTSVVSLKCKDLTDVIRVDSALFGRGDVSICVHAEAMFNNSCQSDVVLNRLQVKCNGVSECQFQAALYHLDIPDPCPKTYKYLEMEYSCIAKPCNQRCYSGNCNDEEICECNERWEGARCDQCAGGYTGPDCSQLSDVEESGKHARSCEGHGVRLYCDSDKSISVDNVFFGRRSESICPHVAGTNTDCQTPTSALETVKALCGGRPDCWVWPNNYVLGEGCYGNYKYLDVDYHCRDCVNLYDEDAACNQLFKDGRCDDDKQSTWMTQHCYKACTQCHIAECGTLHGNLQQCDFWASTDECQKNPSFMLRGCKTSCRDCDSEESTESESEDDDNSGECVDAHDTAECEVWRNEGRCVYLDPWMRKYCGMTCAFCTETKKVLACEGITSVVSLKCKDTDVIRVDSALFGRGDDRICVHAEAMFNNSCQSNETLSGLRERCNGMSDCTFEATLYFLRISDPCPGTYKYLEMEYSCIATPCNQRCYGGACNDDGICVCNQGWDGDLCDQCADGYTGPDCTQQSDVEESGKRGRKCEGFAARLECDSNEGIVIDNVFFGRRSESICPHETGVNTDCEALGSPLEAVTSLCGGRSDCWVWPNNYILGEAEGCYGTYKYLEVDYHCRECANSYDDISACNQLVTKGLCEDEKFSTWMAQHCYKSCSQCHVAECGTLYGNLKTCDFWASTQECQKNSNFMLPECKTSCRGCDAEESTEGESDNDQTDNSGECVDVHDTAECEGWMRQGRCVYLDPWTSKYCAKTCGYCTAPKQVLACEGTDSKVTLRCGSGKLIEVKQALFGRGDSATCVHDSAMLDHSCQSDEVFDKLTARCNWREDCEFEATLYNLQIADSCVGSYKYLEMEYECIDENDVACTTRCLHGSCDGITCGSCTEGRTGEWCNQCAEGYSGTDCQIDIVEGEQTV